MTSSTRVTVRLTGCIATVLLFCLGAAFSQPPPSIDILVLYTAKVAAELRTRGREIGDEIKYVELMQNQIFLNSGVNATVRIFAREWTEFDEEKDIPAAMKCDSGTLNCVKPVCDEEGSNCDPPPNKQLKLLPHIASETASADTYAVRAQREAFGADLVSLWIWQAGWETSGSAASPPPNLTDPEASKNEAYLTLVLSEKAWLYWHFAHEIGHNLGLLHSSGYVDSQRGFRTIMAQDDDCKFNTCVRIPAYSNKDPKFQYFGNPIGDASHDEASKLNKTASFVAAYREPKL